MTRIKRDIVFLILLLVSCKIDSSTLLSRGEITEIEQYLEADSVFVTEDLQEGVYALHVENSRIEDGFVLKMASGVVALKLQEALYNREPQIPYATSFVVDYDFQENVRFDYRLNYLADVGHGLRTIEKVINGLKLNKVHENLFWKDEDCRGDILVKSGVDWESVDYFDLIGFEKTQFIYCGDTLNSLLYRCQMAPVNSFVWVYYSLEENKLQAIFDRPE